MKDGSNNKFDTTNAIIASGIWLLTLIVYVITQAATLSFWDCGEFIAACHVLGIPHPPGSPLYVMLGRIFSVLPFFSDPAVRVNFLSGFCSSLTAVFIYLTSVRILRSWFGTDQTSAGRLLIYGGAVAGSLFAAFSLTNWTNSVEAEVYGTAMMMMMAMFWLSMIYIEKRGTFLSERVMLLIVFLAFLGIGVHTVVFLAFPVLVIPFILKRNASNTAWLTLAIAFAFELYMVFALSSRPGEIPYYLPVGIIFVLFIFYILSFDNVPALYLYVVGGLGVAIAPAILIAGRLLFRIETPEFASGDTVMAWANTLGKIALALLATVAIYGVFVSFSNKYKDVIRQQYRIISGFIAIALVMVGILVIPKGYTTFLVISALVMAGLGLSCRRYLHWPILVAVASISLIVIEVKLFAFGLVVGAIVILILGLIFHMPRWKSALAILIMAMLGFSVQSFIPIRSSQSPQLDENNPSQGLEEPLNIITNPAEALIATVNFLERKQYGSQGMVERMFKRRAEWGNQFGNHRRMGFWGFFNQQYGLTGPQFVFLFLFGVLGVWEIVRRCPVIGLLLLLLLLLSTVGLVLYMNFADGTRQMVRSSIDYLEVRDRDYFFTPAFILFGLGIGLGLAVALKHLNDSVKQFPRVWRKTIFAVSLLLLLLPGLALGGNYNQCDRSNNYFAYDYAWNLLCSADENAVFFTTGDNDTFPLWCLQMAYGVRTDVRVINLALANGKWYVKQIQTILGLDLGWTDKDIDSLRPFQVPDSGTLAKRRQYIDKSVYNFLGLSNTELDSFVAQHGLPYGTTFRISNMVVDKIISKYLGNIPINFSVTGGRSPRKYLGKSIDSSIALHGMAWRMKETGGGISVDMEATIDYFSDPQKFSARGVGDPTIYKNETTRRLTNNYANGVLMVADSLRIVGDIDRAVELVKNVLLKVPHSWDAIEFLVQVYSSQGRTQDIENLIETMSVGDKQHLKALLGLAYRKAGENDTAEDVLMSVLNNDPKNRIAFQGMLELLYEKNENKKMYSLLTQWLQYNPTDQRVRAMLQELDRTGSMRDSSGEDDK